MEKWHSMINFDGAKSNRGVTDGRGVDVYTFNNEDVMFHKLIYLGLGFLGLSKLFMCETYYDIWQPFFGHNNIQFHYIDCDSLVLSFRSKEPVKDLPKLQKIYIIYQKKPSIFLIWYYHAQLYIFLLLFRNNDFVQVLHPFFYFSTKPFLIFFRFIYLDKNSKNCRNHHPHINYIHPYIYI